MNRTRLAVWLVTASAAAAAGWWAIGRPASEPRAPRVEAPPTAARVVAGIIVRDAATRRAIAAGHGARLPSGEGHALHLEVDTSRFRMDVRRGTASLKTYPVALGRDPVGGKSRQGDHRTPRGDYVLVPHHPSPAFGLCFYVCYPGRDDARRGLRAAVIDHHIFRTIISALERGALPPHDTALGGLILIHGTRNRQLRPLTATNWTNGCIAVENRDLLELLAAFAPSDRPTVTIR